MPQNEGVQALADFLKTNTKITSLNLNENNLGTPGAIAIAEALKVNKGLTEVDLSLNYIDDKGAKVIAEMLDVNKTLKTLNTSKNEIGDRARLVEDLLRYVSVCVCLAAVIATTRLARRGGRLVALCECVCV